MTGKVHTYVLDLRRESPSEQWGFSVIGGADQDTPIIVTRVAFGSPANNVLQRGDVISKIGNYDARDVRHQDAQNLFKNAETNIKVVVQRDSSNMQNTSTASSRCSSHTPLSVSPHLSPRGPQQPLSPGSLPPYLPMTPEHSYHQAPAPLLTEGYYREIYPSVQSKRYEGEDIEHVINQPYRTTPLVLPGAKVKKESGATESYLRHHPNPAVRSAPHHLDHDHIMKQRVADSVIQRVVNENPTTKQILHKQFNSPIAVYSEPNIIDTIKNQAGIGPANGTVEAPKAESNKKFDPSISETYKVLQEEDRAQEVVPVQPKVFARNKVIPGKKPLPSHAAQTPPNYLNALGNSSDTIQQSGSFKRLMYHVMAESNY